MQHMLASSTLGKPNGRAAKTGLSVIAIHDGFFAGIRAKEALEWLKHTLGSELQILPISWSFEQLERLDLRATSIRSAAAADVLIVSVSGLKPLPDHIRKWLCSSLAEQWRTHPTLVALHDENTEIGCDQRPACMQLRQVACGLHTNFVCNEDFDRIFDQEFATQLIRRKSQDALHRTQYIGEDFYSTPRVWGIND